MNNNKNECCSRGARKNGRRGEFVWKRVDEGRKGREENGGGENRMAREDMS